MGDSSASACACVTDRGQHWRALIFGQDYRKATPGSVPRVTAAVSAHSSTAHGSAHCMCVAPARAPHCNPCSLEGDRRGVSDQGKVAGWWPGELGLGLVAKVRLA